MLGLVFATMWRRRTQSALLLLLAVVATAGAAAAPGYVAASRRALAVATVEDATVAERVVVAHADQRVSPDPAGALTTFTGSVRDALGLPDAAVVSGASMVGVLNGNIRTLAYRDDVCAHLVVQGACPRSRRRVADRRRLRRPVRPAGRRPDRGPRSHRDPAGDA